MASPIERPHDPPRKIGWLGVLPPCELIAPTRTARRGPAPDLWPEQLEAQAWLAAAGDYGSRRRRPRNG